MRRAIVVVLFALSALALAQEPQPRGRSPIILGGEPWTHDLRTGSTPSGTAQPVVEQPAAYQPAPGEAMESIEPPVPNLSYENQQIPYFCFTPMSNWPQNARPATNVVSRGLAR